MPPTAPSRKPSIRHGTVRAIFAVTGVVDEVSDLILPGAFARTLATRRVKSVFHHEWKDPVGVVLEAEEWKPGDPRFATIPGGAVWPKEAGALVATVQFNMRTQRGRDVYEQVRQWHEHGEAQFSIGYKVPPGAASKRHDGVRIIHSLDLYEVSPVLHGAHSMTRSLEVKSALAGVGVEHKTTWSAIELDRKDAEQQVDRGAMIAVYLPRDAAERIAQPEGTPPRDLHVTLAYLGDAAALGGHPDDLADLVRSIRRHQAQIGADGGAGEAMPVADLDGQPEGSQYADPAQAPQPPHRRRERRDGGQLLDGPIPPPSAAPAAATGSPRKLHRSRPRRPNGREYPARHTYART
ncbi:HK97 family phage prohead protease [Streptomyces sp. NPDC002920]